MVGSKTARAGVVLMCLCPAVFLPGALDRFTLPKLAVAAVAAALILASTRHARLHHAVTGLVVLALGLITASAVVSSLPLWTGLLGREPRFEGIPVILVYVAATAAGARSWARETSIATAQVAVPVLSCSLLAVAAVELLSRAGANVLPSNASRAGSLLGNATDLGSVGVLALPLCIVAAMPATPTRGSPIVVRHRIAAAGVVAAAACVALSGSRADLIAAGCALVLLALIGDRRLLPWILGILGVLVSAAFLVSTTRSRLLGESPLADQSVAGRSLLWRESARLLSHHAVLGVGPSAFESRIVSFHDETWYHRVGVANPPDSPHNIVLQAAAVAGLPLVAVVLSLAGVVIAGAVASLRRKPEARSKSERREFADSRAISAALTCGVAGYAIVLLTYFTTPLSTPLAAWFCGGLVSVGTAGAYQWPARTLAAVSAAVAVVAVVGAAAEIPLRMAVDAAAHGQLANATAEFDTAHELRWWDGDLCATAGHVIVTAASDGLVDPVDAAARAQSWLACATRWAPGDEQVGLDDATELELRHAFQPALAIVQALGQSDPANPELALREGVLLAESGNLRSAIPVLHRAAALDPASPAPWKDLAQVYVRLGLDDAAHSASTRAERLAR